MSFPPEQPIDLPSWVATDQIINVWSELLLAYHGLNGFGGDTAEIYAYTLQRNCPCAEHARDGTDLKTTAEKDRERFARRALMKIMVAFSAQYDCRCEVDGVHRLIWDAQQNFDHRCHVRVVHRKPAKVVAR